MLSSKKPAISPLSFGSNKFYAFLSIVLTGYIFLLFSIGRFDILQQFIIWWVGPIFALIVCLSYLSQPFQLPRELLVFMLFWIYTAIGYPLAIDTVGFVRYFRLIFTIFVLFACIDVVLFRTGNIAIIFKTFILITFLHFIYSLFAGELSFSTLQGENYRFGSLAENPNGNAYMGITGLIGILFIWNEDKSKYKKIYLGITALIFILSIVLTASRSGFISMIALFILWPLYCYRKEIVKNLFLYTLLVIAIVPVIYTADQVISENTYLGKRLKTTASSEDLIEDEKRVRIYIEAFEIFLEHPILGVGLSQFRIYSQYKGVAHSDSMELLSTTGIIGFALTLAMYIIIWRRINKLLRIITDENIIYRLKFFKVIIIVISIFGLFKPNFLDILTMIKVAVISGYTYYLYYELVKEHYLLTVKKRISSPPLPLAGQSQTS